MRQKVAKTINRVAGLSVYGEIHNKKVVNKSRYMLKRQWYGMPWHDRNKFRLELLGREVFYRRQYGLDKA